MSQDRTAYWREYARRPYVRERRKAYMIAYETSPARKFAKKLRRAKFPKHEAARLMAQFMELQP